MLSPECPAQKSLCEEDTSGSDAGSELGLEPETDRFGFIVTNGSAAGSVGPAPELVRQREAKWINIIQQWERMLLKKTSKVKVQCQKGIPASLRAKCWPLLCGATDKMKQNKNHYQTLDSQPALQTWVDVIERDLDRQFPFHEMFLSKDGHGQRGLFRVLKAYTQYQPEEGYCQAQGPVAAVLLMNMPAEEAFWCLVQISEQFLPGYYSPLLEGVLFDAAVLMWVLKRTCPAAHKHLQHHGVEPLMFATDWLMCLFTRHLPFNTLLRVWDLFFCYGVRVLLQVAVVLVRRVLGRAEQRKQCPGQMETLEKLRGVREEVQDEDDAFIAEVCSVPLSIRDLQKRTEKELEKWRKDRPSSTFDPRGRCHGYRMAWARIRQKEEDQDRMEREKGNLSVPLTRSASALSLSPSMLHRWRKGGKANAGEWEGGGGGGRGGRVVRHLSMGAKEDCRSWTEIHFKKVQDVQEEEDTAPQEHHEQNESDQRENTELKEHVKVEEAEEIQGETIEEETEDTETRTTEKKERRRSHMEAEEPSEDQTVVDAPQQAEEPNLKQQEEHTQSESEPSGQSEQMENIEEIETEQAEETITDQTEREETKMTEEENHPKETEERTTLPEQTEEISADDAQQGEEPNLTQTTPEEHRTQSESDPTEHKVPEKTENIEETDTDKTEEAETGMAVKEESQESKTETEEPSEAQAVVDAPQQGEEPHIKQNTPEEQKTPTESDLREHKEPEKMENIEEIETEQAEETTTDQTEQEETTVMEKEESQPKEASHMQAEDPNEDPAEAQTVVDAPQQGEEPNLQQTTPEENKTQSESDITGESKHKEPKNMEKIQEIETEQAEKTIKDQTEVTEKEESQPKETEEREMIQEQTEEPKEHAPQQGDKLDLEEQEEEEDSDHRAAVEENQTETQKEADAETEKNIDPSEEQMIQTVCDIKGHETGDKGEEVQRQQQDEEEITEGKHLDTESVKETDVKVDPHTRTEPAQNTEAQSSQDRCDKVTPAQEAEPTATTDPITPPPNIRTGEEPPAGGPPQIQAAAEERGEITAAGEDDVFVSTDSKVTDRNPNPDRTDSAQATTPHSSSSRSSGDVCIRKSSSSRGSRLDRRLSEDLFTVPQKAAEDPQPEVPSSSSTPPWPTEGAPETTEPPPPPTKRFGLFRRLRREQNKKKIQVPKILIQDFSDVTASEEKPVDDEEAAAAEAEAGEKLSSRERRRRRREKERREKEEEKLKKKRDKELEKERKKKREKDEARPEDTGSQTLRYSASYAQSYF